MLAQRGAGYCPVAYSIAFIPQIYLIKQGGRANTKTSGAGDYLGTVATLPSLGTREIPHSCLKIYA